MIHLYYPYLPVGSQLEQHGQQPCPWGPCFSEPSVSCLSLWCWSVSAAPARSKWSWTGHLWPRCFPHEKWTKSSSSVEDQPVHPSPSCPRGPNPAAIRAANFWGRLWWMWIRGRAFGVESLSEDSTGHRWLRCCPNIIPATESRVSGLRCHRWSLPLAGWGIAASLISEGSKGCQPPWWTSNPGGVNAGALRSCRPRCRTMWRLSNESSRHSIRPLVGKSGP